MIEMRAFAPDRVPIPGAPLYISIDLDAFDPAFAPGVSHHEPGGLSVRDILSVLDRVTRPIVGADVVEYNPSRDITACRCGCGQIGQELPRSRQGGSMTSCFAQGLLRGAGVITAPPF